LIFCLAQEKEREIERSAGGGGFGEL